MRRRLSFANVTAVIALFIALGGGAYAITRAPKNSVTSKSIQNGAVSSKDVKNDSLTDADISDEALVGDSGSTYVQLDGEAPLNGSPEMIVNDALSTKAQAMLFVEASVSVTGGAGNTAVAACTVSIDGNRSDAYQQSPGAGAGTLSVIFAFPVSAGRHETSLDCQALDGSAAVSAAGMATWTLG